MPQNGSELDPMTVSFTTTNTRRVATDTEAMFYPTDSPLSPAADVL